MPEGSYYGSDTRRITNNINQAVATGAVAGSVVPAGQQSASYYRPYPAYGNVTIIHSQANADYSSLQVKLQQQFRDGISFLLGYTYSKSMDNAHGLGSTSSSSGALPQDSNCPGCQRGLSDFNQKSRLVMSPVIQLPFGEGKPWMNHGFPAAVGGGWQLSSLVQAQTGRPFTVDNTNTNVTLAQNSADLPNQYGNPNMGGTAYTAYWSLEVVQYGDSVCSGYLHASNTPASLISPGPRTGHTVVAPTGATTPTGTVYGFGDEHRNAVIGPGLVQWDLAIQRLFTFTGRYSASLRFEAINVLNHPSFQNPVADSAASGVGGSQYCLITLACCSTQPNSRDLQLSGKFYF